MLKLKNISKSYVAASYTQKALDDVSINFRKSEFVAILGQSGSGKTTLLNVIGGLDKYDSGDLIINGKSTKKFKNKEWDAYRNNCIGFIFQSYNLITHISVLDNVEMSMTLSGVSRKEKKKRAIQVLEKVGLKDHIHKRPNQLSGGQMQRVAIARALVNDPDIIMADEPTGALDTKTSIEIMELIKEIAKDKLVIMVTHNPELANDYATRIINLKDGKITNDSNPLNEEDATIQEYELKKTSMNFLTALGLSFNNIRTKKGRTLLTAFASSIGIIGIALILSLSNGFDKQIDKFEQDTLSQMPVIITTQSMEMSEEDMQKMLEDSTNTIEEYSDEKIIRPLKNVMDAMHKNNITKEYVEYVENVDSELISGIGYNRATKLNVLYKTNNDVKMIDVSTAFFPFPENLDGSTDNTVIDEHFELIHGNMPKEKNELVILVDSKNRINSQVLKLLGYDENAEVSFDEILNKEFKVVLNNNLYKNMGNYFTMSTDYNSLYNNENNITLKITGVIRGKKDDAFGEFSGTGIVYKQALMNYIIENNQNSEVVKAQRELDYNILTGEKFNLEEQEGKEAKEMILAYLGDDTSPIVIQLYPKNFELKDKLLEYLDKYNENKEVDDKIIYTDSAKMISSLSGGIMDAITWVLIGFSSISLVVSTIMISIITYISVLERTKEIGILRAIGARKKDVTRVFNAETFIIGMFSGMLGILIARALIIPINGLLKALTDLDNVAQMNPVHAVVLLTISVILTLIGGFIPAKIAAKKNPVESLRTE